MDTNKAKKFLIGYWPLLQPQDLQVVPGQVFDPGEPDSTLDQKIGDLDKIEIPSVQAVLWLGYPFDRESWDECSAIPVFVTDRAKEIADHLLMWIDGDTDRFTLHFEQRDIGYACLLLPSVKKSIERWKLARLIYHEDMVTDDDFVVYYHVLGTCCFGGSTYQKVKDDGKIANPCFVGFLDREDLDMANPLQVDTDKITIVGPFEIVDDDENAAKHLNELFDDGSGKSTDADQDQA